MTDPTLYNRFQANKEYDAAKPRSDDLRSEIAKDRDRIVHSSAFRRLQGKSQIVGVEVGDFFRTRITHSFECAQIGRGIATNVMNKDAWETVVVDQEDFPDLVEAACLAHDLGHPPFGHNGEKALAERMRKLNSSLFEGNAQSLRIATLLEPKVFAPTELAPSTPRWLGLDLTRSTLRALIKYPEIETKAMLDEEHPKFGCYDDQADRDSYDWVWRDVADPKKTLAAEIMDVSDDIAYAVHDFEDGVWAGMIPLYELLQGNAHYRRLLEQKVLASDDKRDAGKRLFANDEFTGTFEALFESPEAKDRLEYLREVGYDRTREARARLKNFTAWLIGELINAVSGSGKFVNPTDEVARRIVLLKEMAWLWMIERTDMATLHFGQERLITRVFEGYWASPEQLPRREEWLPIKAKGTPDQLKGEPWPEKARLICDHIAGMTDGYAHAVYDQMYRASQRRDLRLAY
jgi:dGTPase